MVQNSIIQSSLYEISPIDFPQGDEYISDIELITMSDTGIIDAQVINMTLRESCMMLVNAIKVFRLGFFDCAFYSLRQTIELSVGGIYLYTNKDKIKDWNRGTDGFEKGRMAQFLKQNDTTFCNIREKMAFYFDGLRKVERSIDKYVHKQGVGTFYTYHRANHDYRRNHLNKIAKDFEKHLIDCIGAVLVYRLVIDPLPLLLSDDNITFRSPDFITEPFSQRFTGKYISTEIINAYKQTDIYQGYYADLSAREKQNDAIYNLIHYQCIDRNDIDKYLEQSHLISYHDKLALILFFSSSKVSNCYLMNGNLWYFSETDSHREKSSFSFGNDYFMRFFPNDNSFNMPFENVFISRCNAFREIHYFEHNFPLNEQEILLIEQNVATINSSYEETNKKFTDWYNVQSSKQEIVL